jgi:penicillin-binding protein 1C
MRPILHHLKKHSLLVGSLLLGFGFWLMYGLPNPLFHQPYSLVIEDRQGELLGAHIAPDGQWRFPRPDSISDYFATALLEFEDHRFHQHFGIDPIGLGRAFWQNIKNRKIVSGGSTISMQLIRLARGGKRTLKNKTVEIFMATRLESRYSKQEILQMYAAHAPFGGNVVGLEAASWRYFGKSPHRLTWGEAALLAVLPNAPSLIHPGKNRDALLQKRNRLLDRLQQKGKIDETSCRLAKLEPLPDKPKPLPRLAPHLMERIHREYYQKKSKQFARVRTTLDIEIQTKADQLLRHHLQVLKNNQIHNVAGLIMEVETGAVRAYIGNILGTGAEHGEMVDIITAPRSTGSILKPFLYSSMLEEGMITPQRLVSDIPTVLSGYRPENFNQKFDGVVTARQALIRSLNVPMVEMLREYGLEKFHYQLRKMGMTTLYAPPGHYGLPLILGGAEANLWDLSGMYGSMARTLNHQYHHDGWYRTNDFFPPTYLEDTDTLSYSLRSDPPIVSTSALWHTFDALQYLERPNQEGDWQQFSSSRRIAWKTGTSFGFRDAWAIGITPEYVVAVWAGNADGEGRPGLVGVYAAAPALFNLFDLLPAGSWFTPPYDELVPIPVCSKSGYRPLAICPVDTLFLPPRAKETAACPYHRKVHLNQEGTYQVTADCVSPDEMQHRSWFVLPPVEEYFYQTKVADYRELPPMAPGCGTTDNSIPFQLIYPKEATEIYVPVDLDGSRSRTVFQAAHRQANTRIHWHIDSDYVGTTETFHHIELDPPAGDHILTLVDEDGYRLQRKFQIIEKEERNR